MPGIIPSLHLDHGMLSVATSRQADQEKIPEVYLYDISKGLLQEIGVSVDVSRPMIEDYYVSALRRGRSYYVPILLGFILSLTQHIYIYILYIRMGYLV